MNENNFFSHAKLDTKFALKKSLAAVLPEPDIKKPVPFVVNLLNAFPLIAGLSDSISSSGRNIIQISNITHAAHKISQGSVFFNRDALVLGMVLSTFDFIRIPAIFFVSWMAGQPAPLKPSKLASWLYSGLALGLGIAALAISGAAPIIGLVASVIGVVASIFLLSRTLYLNRQYNNKLHALNEKVATLENRLEEKKQALQTLSNKSTAPSSEETFEMQTLIAEIESLTEAAKPILTQQAIMKEKLEKRGTQKIIDKIVATFLSALTVIGTILALMFPVAGLTILTAAALIGGGYLITTAFIIPALLKRAEKPSSVVDKQEKGDTNEKTKHSDKNFNAALQDQSPQESVEKKTIIDKEVAKGNSAVTEEHRASISNTKSSETGDELTSEEVQDQTTPSFRYRP